MSTDAQMIAGEYGLDAATTDAWLSRLAIVLADDPDADIDEAVLRFGADSQSFAERYFDPASAYTGLRSELRDAIVHEAYTMIRQAAGSHP